MLRMTSATGEGQGQMRGKDKSTAFCGEVERPEKSNSSFENSSSRSSVETESRRRRTPVQEAAGVACNRSTELEMSARQPLAGTERGASPRVEKASDESSSKHAKETGMRTQ